MRAARALLRVALLGALVAATLASARPAEACGGFCPGLPPPDPPPPPPEQVGAASFSVNQQSEQIIFDVRDGKVSAHVLIRYEGAPEQFAWLVPVPSPPELELGSSLVFALLDEATAPAVTVQERNLCPSPEHVCRTHPPPACPTPEFGGGVGGSAGVGGAEAPRSPIRLRPSR